LTSFEYDSNIVILMRGCLIGKQLIEKNIITMLLTRLNKSDNINSR